MASLASLLLLPASMVMSQFSARDLVHVSSSLPVATVGYVDIPAPVTGTRVAWVPVDLRSKAPHRIVLSYSLQSKSAGAEVGLAPGVIAIGRGADEGFIRVRVGRDKDDTGQSCWSDPGAACASFSIALNPVGNDAAIGTPSGVDWIIGQARSTQAEVSVGDAGLMGRTDGEADHLDVPLILSRPVNTPVRVTWQFISGGAVDHTAFSGRTTSTTFAPKQDSSDVEISVLAAPGLQPFETLYVKIVDVEGAVIGRSLGFGVITTQGLGVPNPLSSEYSAATLTQVLSTSGRMGDTYDVDATSPGTTTFTSSHLIAPNDRMILWPEKEVSQTSEESCATWESQSPSQAPGVPIQQGLVLRAATIDGVARAITVTKAVWENNFTSIDVDTWNTALEVPFRRIDEIDLAPYFQSNSSTTLPLNVCAAVKGSTLSFEVWVPNAAPPPWGDTQQGATVDLPGDWDYAGEAGWYVGHLPSQASTVYTNEYAGPIEAAPSA